ncbi:tyrosine-protein kinase Tec isoform X2 [Electrophorus electricus]|nr:tyrosine-protein kinase Tec isoform X2 [Electrophorus electricus]XP_035377506.1 tyrosine-protein kinase Tec isoform X2 [Electrophorus electricus]
MYSIFCCCCGWESCTSTHVDLNSRSGHCNRSPGYAGRTERSMKKLPLPPPENMEGEQQKLVALYDFTATERSDLSLTHGEEYTLLHKQDRLWWMVQDKDGNKGFIPSNYVTGKHNIEANKWYCKNINRSEAENLLRQEGKDGGFIVRDSSQPNSYTVSVYTKGLRQSTGDVRHYHIKQTDTGQFFLAENYIFSSIPKVIEYHQHNAAGLVTRLRYPVGPMGKCLPATAGFSSDKWEIKPSELTFMEELGSGQFGEVYLGKWRALCRVAIKVIKEGAMCEEFEEDFIEEAKIMTNPALKKTLQQKLCHPKLVQLYGVCTTERPLCIVTEVMEKGSLLQFLQQSGDTMSREKLLSVCQDVCEGMQYLEENNFIHRDLAARNCLVNENDVVKVCDFGMTRYVLDNQYTSSLRSKFPVKWSPPEVLHYSKYSSKSDVWSFGVLMWEVFSDGRTPFGNKSNAEVVEEVTQGRRLYKPHKCPPNIYDIMFHCWHERPHGRPSFSRLLQSIKDTVEEDNL